MINKAYFTLYVASYALKIVYHTFVCMDYCVITRHVRRLVWFLYVSSHACFREILGFTKMLSCKKGQHNCLVATAIACVIQCVGLCTAQI